MIHWIRKAFVPMFNSYQLNKSIYLKDLEAEWTTVKPEKFRFSINAPAEFSQSDHTRSYIEDATEDITFLVIEEFQGRNSIGRYVTMSQKEFNEFLEDGTFTDLGWKQ